MLSCDVGGVTGSLRWEPSLSMQGQWHSSLRMLARACASPLLLTGEQSFVTQHRGRAKSNACSLTTFKRTAGEIAVSFGVLFACYRKTKFQQLSNNAFVLQRCSAEVFNTLICESIYKI